jgi:deoxyribose-phosphate aldolase
MTSIHRPLSPLDEESRRRSSIVAVPTPRQERVPLDQTARLEHALLGPAVTPTEVDDACASAIESGFAALIVWPNAVGRAVSAAAGTGLEVVAAVGAPVGASLRDTKIDEARRAMAAGARHLAVAVDAGRFRGGDAGVLAGEVVTLAYLAHAEGVHLRAVLAAAALTEDELVIAGRLAAESGADVLQTGFGMGEHATVEQVMAARRALPPRHRDRPVIAGGARDAGGAAALLDGGASRVVIADPAAVLSQTPV